MEGIFGTVGLGVGKGWEVYFSDFLCIMFGLIRPA